MTDGYETGHGDISDDTQPVSHKHKSMTVHLNDVITLQPLAETEDFAIADKSSTNASKHIWYCETLVLDEQ